MTEAAGQVDRAEWMFRFVAALVIFFLERIMRWRIETRGLDNVPTTGGAIITFNHHSYADFFMCAWGPTRHLGRPVRFLAKQELFEKPVLGWIIRKANQIPVDRSSREGRASAFTDAVLRLKNGAFITIAPEQTISQSFELLPFTTGTARMAQQAGVPVVPSVSWGSQRWATKGRPINWRARRIPVLVAYGEPIEIAPDEDLEKATERIREAMLDLLDGLQRDYPDRPEAGDDWWLPRRLGGSAPDHDDVLRSHLERSRGWRGRES